MDKRKSSIIFLVVVCIFSVNFNVVLAEDIGAGITPYALNLSDLKGDISITSSGNANCKGIYKSNNTKKKVLTITLQRENGNSWTNVKSWNKTNAVSGTSVLEKKLSVTKNKKYRVRAYVEVLNSSGKVIERMTSYSKIVKY